MKYKSDPQIPLKEVRKCHWCSNALGTLKNIYKGQGSERWYCSSGHLKAGEERAVIAKVRAGRESWNGA